MNEQYSLIKIRNLPDCHRAPVVKKLLPVVLLASVTLTA